MADTLQALGTRDKEAMAIVYRNMMWSGGLGVLPFPVFDLIAITGVQVKLSKELADFYGVPFRKDLAKSIVMGLLGTLTTGTLTAIVATASLKWIPGIGNLLAFLALPTSAAAITYAVGRVYIQHFEAGGTLLDLDPKAVKEYFRHEFEQGQQEAVKVAAATSGKKSN